MFGKTQWCSGFPPGLVLPLSSSVSSAVSGTNIRAENCMCPAGLASFLIIRMYFGKAASDFNQSIQGQGTHGPQLIANTSNAFTSKLSLNFSSDRVWMLIACVSGLGWLRILCCTSGRFIGKASRPRNKMNRYLAHVGSGLGHSAYYCILHCHVVA